MVNRNEFAFYIWNDEGNKLSVLTKESINFFPVANAGYEFLLLLSYTEMKDLFLV